MCARIGKNSRKPFDFFRFGVSITFVLKLSRFGYLRTSTHQEHGELLIPPKTGSENNLSGRGLRTEVAVSQTPSTGEDISGGGFRCTYKPAGAINFTRDSEREIFTRRGLPGHLPLRAGTLYNGGP